MKLAEIVTETETTLPTEVHSDSNDPVVEAPPPAPAAGCAATRAAPGAISPGAIFGVVLGLALAVRRRRPR